MANFDNGNTRILQILIARRVWDRIRLLCLPEHHRKHENE
jgi:hypothetical protein